jgi:sentrin-specific protease 1
MSEFNILQSEKGWLNDEIINDSMNILVSNNSSKNVICLSTFFYSSLAHDNTFKYLNVIKWNYNTDIFSFDKILLPINIDNMHWVLVVVFIKSSTIIYYDSLLSNSKTANLILVNILKWLKIEGEIRNRNSNLWTTTINDSIPKQENTYDCGLYIIKFAEYIIKGETLNKNTFDKDKKTFRKQILEKLQENDK